LIRFLSDCSSEMISKEIIGLKTVFVSHSGEKGGAPIVLTRLFRQALKEEKEEVYLVFRYQGELAEACRKEFGEGRVFTIRDKDPRKINTLNKPFRKLVDLYRLVKLFKEIKPQIVIANSLINTSAIVAGLWVRAKVAVWAHEVPGMINDPLRLRSFWIRKARFGIGVSEQVCEYLKELGMDPAKIRLIHHGLDLEGEIHGNQMEEIIPPRGLLKLGALAVWSPRKRLDLIMETAVELARSGRFNQVRLDIGGPMDLWFPHLFAEIMGRFSEKPPSLTVRFLGSIEELNLFYQDLDAVLVTSDKEALPTVVLEALVRQIPVFSFEDLRGVQEILGETALLARERNGAALAEKVIQFFINPDHLDTLEQWQKAAMSRSRLFSLENQWKAFQKVLSGLG